MGKINGRAVSEKELTIKVAEKLERYFLADSRFEVRLTRRQDVYLGLAERAEMASKTNGDLFISIHANAVEGKEAQKRAKGFEIWTWNREANRSAAARAIERLENDEPGMSNGGSNLLNAMMRDALESQALESKRFARAVHSRALRHPYLKKHDRGIESAKFRVLEIYDMPSILVELGFMTHPEEVKLMFTSKFQEDWAKIMYDGVVEYYQQTDPTFPRREVARR
jgi:N-acetylmuramoyl-L-alanine amidase